MQTRAGSALILLGLIALVIFMITFSAEQADIRVFLFGAGLSVLGLMIRRRAVRETSRRGRLLRRLFGRPPDEEIL